MPTEPGSVYMPQRQSRRFEYGKKISLLDIEPLLLGRSSLSQVITLRYTGCRSVSEHWHLLSLIITVLYGVS